jgi:hypothetical protein
MPDAVDTVVCAPDDGWWYHPKNVEQFPDKINCVTLHLVGYMSEFITMHGPMNVNITARIYEVSLKNPYCAAGNNV